MLDLNYRPKTFDEVMGNDATVAVLRNRSKKSTLGTRSYMLGGPKGTGKTTLARIIARSILCEDRQDGNPCNICSHCLAALQETHECLLEFDAASQGSVDRIRKIVDELDYSHTLGLPTIIILDEAHRLGPAAQDAMLKAMEERRFIVIMCTTEPNKIRPALRDRVDEFGVKPTNAEVMVRRLKTVCEQENIAADAIALFEIASACGGSPRVALNAIEFLSRDSQINLSGVRSYFKFDAISDISHALMSFPTDQVYALSVLDPVMAVESPAWVRTVISDLVVNSFRKSKGLPHKYSDFATLYNTAHAYPWMDLVAHLGAILKPCAPDIEAALFKFLKPAQPSVNIPQEPRSDDVKPVLRLQKPAPQAPKVQGPTGAKKVLAIDGITFDSEERITSLHDRMEGSRGPTGPSAPEIPTGVKLDIAKVPLSEQEFIRGLRSRFQK